MRCPWTAIWCDCSASLVAAFGSNRAAILATTVFARHFPRLANRVAPGGRWLAFTDGDGELQLLDAKGRQQMVAEGFIDYTWHAASTEPESRRDTRSSTFDAVKLGDCF
jgi:hypothetical protein